MTELSYDSKALFSTTKAMEKAISRPNMMPASTWGWAMRPTTSARMGTRMDISM